MRAEGCGPGRAFVPSGKAGTPPGAERAACRKPARAGESLDPCERFCLPVTSANANRRHHPKFSIRGLRPHLNSSFLIFHS